MSAIAGESPWLLADIGGTNLRAALCDGPEAPPRALRHFACADFPDIAAALGAYLAECGAVPLAACFAVAGPVLGDEFSFTNSPWRFSVKALCARFGIARLELLNDFAALALALPALGSADTVAIGGGARLPGRTRAVLGPGTGLGVAALVECGAVARAVAGEGGNMGFSPQDELQRAVFDVLRRGGARVTSEMILSGRGLAAVYRALAQIEGRDAQIAPHEVTRRGLAGSDPVARRTLQVFCEVLGAVAGDIAMLYGAAGGVYIGGGIAPRLLPLLAGGGFRARFEDKLAQRDYVAAMPTLVITAATPALLGARRNLEQGGLSGITPERFPAPVPPRA